MAEDVKRQQNYILYRLLRAKHAKERLSNAELPEYPPVMQPMVYQA